MFPESTELHLFDRIDLVGSQNPNTKNQFADILTKGNFTRDEWIHFCVCITLAISVTTCSEVMSTRMQKDAGEGRVTAKEAGDEFGLTTNTRKDFTMKQVFNTRCME